MGVAQLNNWQQRHRQIKHDKHDRHSSLLSEMGSAKTARTGTEGPRALPNRGRRPCRHTAR